MQLPLCHPDLWEALTYLSHVEFPSAVFIYVTLTFLLSDHLGLNLLIFLRTLDERGVSACARMEVCCLVPALFNFLFTLSDTGHILLSSAGTSPSSLEVLMLCSRQLAVVLAGRVLIHQTSVQIRLLNEEAPTTQPRPGSVKTLHPEPACRSVVLQIIQTSDAANNLLLMSALRRCVSR